tara:strand:+ start:5262 stop:6452 length:1191 start_codon:yes stop_codon:yes gene_type:complete
MKQIFLSVIFLAYGFISIINNPIIIRHDVPEKAYIEFARELPVTDAIVMYNSTDLAGTLISDQWVLSAAHVAETIKDGHKLIINGDSVGIEKIIIHPEWESNNRPDIALIKLKRKIENVKPIPLYTLKDEIDKEVIVAGIGDFGTGKTGVEGKPGIMRAATNLVDGVSSDGQYLFWLFDSPDNERVTDLEGISGPGDSSGPALIVKNNTYYIAGVSSAQSTRATNGVEGMYGVTEYFTRVSQYVNWIQENIQKNSHENAFDFWLGDWEVSWTGPDSTRVVGSNMVTKILDDKVIQENFIDPTRNFKGTSISVFNPQTEQWYQTWADNQGGYYNFIGKIDDNTRIFEMKEKDARGALYRMIFLDIKQNSFIWKWQGIRDGFDDWKTVWEIQYNRKKE